ncbi:hypothetical protein V8E55_006969 [Tylopilus felleus]
MFFHMPALPEPTIDQEILTTLSADDTATEDNYTLLTQLDQAMFPDEREESAVDDFMVTLFRLLGYALRPRIIRTRKEMQLLICGEYRFAKADIVIIDKSQNDIILLVQEDKRLGGYLDPLPQLVAEAISAFQSNNLRRVASGLDPLENKVIPGIIMVGTSPTFFKIPVTTELTQCVQRGDYPATPTIVLGHMPEIPRPAHRQSEGMKPLDNRRIILQCYEAFKQFIVY